MSWASLWIVDRAGDLEQLLNYSVDDKKPYNEISYYRLKQVDYSGEYKYSNTVSAKVDRSKL